MTRPIVSALMFTSVRGWILPEADTIASSRRFWTASTLTSAPLVFLNLTLANDNRAEEDDDADADQYFLVTTHERLVNAATHTAISA